MVAVPLTVVVVEPAALFATSLPLALCLVINGVFFHGQTIAAYYLMDFISPVTHRYLVVVGGESIVGKSFCSFS